MNSLLLMPQPAWFGIVTAVALLLGWHQILRRSDATSERLEDLECDWTFFKLMAVDPDTEEDEPAQNSEPEPSPLPVGLPSVIFSREAFEMMTQAMRRDLDRRPDVETGFALVGRLEGDGLGRQIIINGLIEAGNRHDRSSGHVRFNRDFQQSRLERMQLIDRRSSHIGDAHTHPGSLDRCSHGDLVTDVANVNASATQEMVFVIATELRHHTARRGLDAMSLYSEGLKVDVFYLGFATNCQYQRVVPMIVDDEPAVPIPPLLDRLVDAFPDRFPLDWACLRSLKGWQLRIRQIHLGGLDQDCLELSCQTAKCRIVLVMAEDVTRAPLAFVEEPEAINQFEPRFLAGGWTEHIWLTEIVLAILREKAEKPIPIQLQPESVLRQSLGIE